MTVRAISTACPPALGRVRGPAPVDSPWKSLRAPERGRIPVGKLAAVRPELLQCQPSHRTEQTHRGGPNTEFLTPPGDPE